jgi:hypothetical protein
LRHEGPWTLTMEAEGVCRPMVADSHLFEEEQDPDLDLHQSEKSDPDPDLHQSDEDLPYWVEDT